jgi:hypothetical protein
MLDSEKLINTSNIILTDSEYLLRRFQMHFSDFPSTKSQNTSKISPQTTIFPLEVDCDLKKK